MVGYRILIDARMVRTPLHGIARYTLNLIHGLTSLGHEVSALVSHHETVQILSKAHVKETLFCRASFTNPLELLELPMKFQQQTADIYHLPSFAVGLQTPPNSVITIHDMIHLHPPAELHHKVYYQTVVRRALNSCGSVITVSEWSRAEIAKRLRIPLEKIFVIRNGLEEKWFEKKPLPKAQKDANPYFLVVGNTKEHKNLETALRASADLWEKGVEFELRLALGDQGLPPHLEKLLPASKQLRILSRLSDEDLRLMYAGAQALVAPSLLEGYNYPIAEALSQGTTVIASPIPSHQEFKAMRLCYYESPLDWKSLSLKMEKTLLGPSDGGAATHDVIDRRQMAAETVEVYESVLQKIKSQAIG